MTELFCLLCGKESTASEYDDCPKCGARGKWAHLVDTTVDEKNPLLVNSRGAYEAVARRHGIDLSRPIPASGECFHFSAASAKRLVAKLRESDLSRARSIERAKCISFA